MQGSCGELLVAGYFEYIYGCDFVHTNVKIPKGEMDVVGIHIGDKTKIIYIAEVAFHVETGLRYTKNGKSANVERLIDKFTKDIEYIKSAFPDYVYKVQFWSPIVKKNKPKNNLSQIEEVMLVQKEINNKFRDLGIELELIINEEFQAKINNMKKDILSVTNAIEGNDVLRYIQIEAKLNRFLEKSNK